LAKAKACLLSLTGMSVKSESEFCKADGRDHRAF
jgi:hypothetical protein